MSKMAKRFIFTASIATKTATVAVLLPKATADEDGKILSVETVDRASHIFELRYSLSSMHRMMILPKIRSTGFHYEIVQPARTSTEFIK